MEKNVHWLWLGLSATLPKSKSFKDGLKLAQPSREFPKNWMVLSSSPRLTLDRVLLPGHLQSIGTLEQGTEPQNAPLNQLKPAEMTLLLLSDTSALKALVLIVIVLFVSPSPCWNYQQISPWFSSSLSAPSVSLFSPFSGCLQDQSVQIRLQSEW